MIYFKAAVARARTTLSVFVVIVLAGVAAYRTIPVELAPDVTVPIIITTILYPGISPEDAERLLVRPTEIELKDVDGITQVRSFASENAATIITEFDVSFNPSLALQDIRSAMDRAQARFPQDTEQPLIQEISAATVPVVQIALSGDNVPERTLLQVAQELQRHIENLPEILSADRIGAREEMLEVIVNPARMETYGITNAQVVQAVTSNNRLIPAGTLNTGSGSFAIKVPGLIETAQDLFDLPIVANEDGVIVLSDLAEIRRTFMDAERYAFANGQRAISLDIQKRKGANLIEAMDKIDAIIREARTQLPPSVEITYLNNTIPIVLEQNSGLQGNMATAMVLVMIIVVASVGIRSGILVALSVPFSFFFAFIIISMLGFTYNFMVIFGLMLGLGILIDGAIVMVEYADRKMGEGLDRAEAYAQAVQRMFWPITISTITTLAAFLPLLFWPGVAGEFMSYLPTTVFAVLIGSLLYALLFAPLLGTYFGSRSSSAAGHSEQIRASEDGPAGNPTGIVGAYASILRLGVNNPISVAFGSVGILVLIIAAYFTFGRGVEFFTQVEPMQTQVRIFARGNLSPEEVREIVLDVEDRVREVGYFEAIVTQSGAGRSMGGGMGAAPDLVGTIFLEFTDRRTRSLNGFDIENAYRDAVSDIPGVRTEIVRQESGPPVGKQIQLEFFGDDLRLLIDESRRVLSFMEGMEGLIDIDDTAPVPGIEWEITVDRARAAMSGASMTEIGTAIQLLTNGVRMGDFRPDDSEEEVEIRVRYPQEYRGVEQIDDIRINTPGGLVPISSFIDRTPLPGVSSIQRVDGNRVIYVRANPAPGYLADDKVQELRQWLTANPLAPGVSYRFRGANEEQAEAFSFLAVAFALAIALMGILLVTQFNSYYQTFLILSSVILSTTGVLLGLLITGQTFSVILTGIGIVSLAGIVINNNIILIDTYNHLRARHPKWSVEDLVIQTGIQRLRPVFLTTFTTGFGLLPLALGFSIDLVGAEIEFGGPIASQWAALANAIVFGLTFSTLLTLVVTPALLVLPYRLRDLWRSAQTNVRRQIRTA